MSMLRGHAARLKPLQAALAAALLALSATSGAQTTVTGGDLFVATQGPVGVTLLGDGGLNPYELTFVYDYVFGIATNNQQDKWGQAPLFSTGAAAGSSASVTLQPAPLDLTHGIAEPSTYPKGTPIELLLSEPGLFPDSRPIRSSTAVLNKDFGGPVAGTAMVSYGQNNTALVSFPSGGGAFGFRVGLTNVFGSGSASIGSGGGGGCK